MGYDTTIDNSILMVLWTIVTETGNGVARKDRTMKQYQKPTLTKNDYLAKIERSGFWFAMTRDGRQVWIDKPLVNCPECGQTVSKRGGKIAPHRLPHSFGVGGRYACEGGE